MLIGQLPLENIEHEMRELLRTLSEGLVDRRRVECSLATISMLQGKPFVDHSGEIQQLAKLALERKKIPRRLQKNNEDLKFPRLIAIAESGETCATKVPRHSKIKTIRIESSRRKIVLADGSSRSFRCQKLITQLIEVLKAYDGQFVSIEKLNEHLYGSESVASHRMHRLVSRTRKFLQANDVIETRGNSYALCVERYDVVLEE